MNKTIPLWWDNNPPFDINELKKNISWLRDLGGRRPSRTYISPTQLNDWLHAYRKETVVWHKLALKRLRGKNETI